MRTLYRVGILTLIVLILLIGSQAPLAFADTPMVYMGKEAIREALTEGTLNPRDDEGSEFVHEIQWENTPYTGGVTFDRVIQAFRAVRNYIGYQPDEVTYGVEEAWANTEMTLTQGVGDCEDKAILLASLIKFHTYEFDPAKDKVYVVIGFVRAGYRRFTLHAWVLWYDGSSRIWFHLDPTTGYIGLFTYPGVAMLWFNDEHVFGFLPGYYP